MVQETLASALATRYKMATILAAHSRPALTASQWQGSPGPGFVPVGGVEYFSPADYNRAVELGWLAPYVRPVQTQAPAQFTSYPPAAE